MVGFKTIVSHWLLVLSIVLAAREVDAEETGAPSVAIHFTFNRPADASMAPFFMAAKDGRFGAEHLNVSFNSAAGSPEALARVAACNNGLGGLDPARFDRSIDQITEDFRFRKRPAAGDTFDGRFLPPVESRLIN